jgi:hypothetical protein
MNLEDFANVVGIANGMCSLLGYLPKAINKVIAFTYSGFELKASDEEVEHLNEYVNYKKSKEERKSCKAILKKHNLPKSVGIMCRSGKDICFMPNKTIVDKTMNNLNLKSSDGLAKLTIGGGFFAFTFENNGSGKGHKNILNGTVIKHNSEIYLLRHPLGGYPNYLAKLDIFINGMIIELDDGFKVGVYYQL